MVEKAWKLVNFRADPADVERWDEAAHADRKSRTQWMVDLLNQATDPLNLLKKAPGTPLVTQTSARKVANELKERASKAASKGSGTCFNRVPVGAFCKKCGRIHRA